MRIRYLLASGLLSIVIISMLNLWALSNNIAQFEANDVKQATTDRIARETTNLVVLSQDYLLHNTPRAARQWRAVHARLMALVKSFDTSNELYDHTFRAINADLRSNLETLPTLLDTLEITQDGTNSNFNTTRQSMLADHWVAQTRRMGDTAFAFSQWTANERIQLRKSHNRIQIGTQLFLSLLFLLLAWWCWRRILRPMALLQKATQAIESGQLGAQTDYDRQDEFGDLARSFNTMGSALHLREKTLNRHMDYLARSESTQIRVGRMANIGSWDVHPLTGTVKWSHQTQLLLELDDRAETTLHEALSFFDETSREQLQEAINHAVHHGAPWDLNLSLTTARGKQRWVRLQGEVEQQAATIHLVGAIQDITERHNEQLQLATAMTTAEQASMAKSAFLANISHEIRTPMNAVVSITYLLEQTPLNQDQRNLLSKVKTASQSLLGLISDVLDLAKIEANELTITQAPVHLPTLFQDLMSMMAANAVARNVQLSLEMPIQTPEWVMGDALHLRQIISNLLSNAIKFTENGQVQLQITENRATAEQTLLHIAVQDNGIGIAPDIMPLLFQPFTQADDSTTRQFGGMGLGLSIVKKLCTAMGGDIHLRSTLGQGSRFVASVPFTICSAPTTGQTAPTALRLLIADDDPVCCQMIQQMTNMLGWNTTIVHSAADVIEQVQHAMRTKQPLDAMILDWEMPQMSGLEALAKLHQEWQPDDLPKVIMVTSHERSALLSAPHAELLDAVLTKPTSPTTIFNAVHSALVRRHGNANRILQSSTVESAGVQRLPGLHILVVDDSPINQEVASKILQREGARVTLADNGQHAVDLVRANPNGFDAILMDIQMPVMDGLQATQRIRLELKLNVLPIIALTAGAMATERQRAIEQGMTDFVTKPFDPSSLVLLIRRCTEQVRGQALEITLRETEHHNETPADQWPSLSGISQTDAYQLLSGDVALFAKLLGRMLHEYPDMGRSPIRTPVDAAERKPLAAHLHKLRGVAGMLGAKSIHAAASQCENTLRADPWSADTFAQAATALYQAWGVLQASASAWLATQREQAAATAAEEPDHTVDHATLRELLKHLQEQDLSAADQFETLTPGLRQMMPADTFTDLERNINQLDFASAAQTLQTWLETAPPPTDDGA